LSKVKKKKIDKKPRWIRLTLKALNRNDIQKLEIKKNLRKLEIEKKNAYVLCHRINITEVVSFCYYIIQLCHNAVVSSLCGVKFIFQHVKSLDICADVSNVKIRTLTVILRYKGQSAIIDSKIKDFY
jgi:hypothetical protein